MINFLASHVLSFVSAASILGIAVGWLAKEIPNFSEKEVAIGLLKLENSKNPAIKVFGQDLDTAILKLVPDAGDARYAAAADVILKELPPQAAIARSAIIIVLSALASGAKAGAQDAAKQDAAKNAP